MKLTGGQIVIETLVREGVPYIVGIPGHGVEVSWSVASINAPFATGAAWRDAIYLSTDERFDPGLDVLLGARGASSGLLVEGGGDPSYAATRRVVVPPASEDGQRFLRQSF